MRGFPLVLAGPYRDAAEGHELQETEMVGQLACVEVIKKQRHLPLLAAAGAALVAVQRDVVKAGGTQGTKAKLGWDMRHAQSLAGSEELLARPEEPLPRNAVRREHTK